MHRHKLKSIYNSEQFKPIKNALVSAASNTAQKYIDKGNDKLVSKKENEECDQHYSRCCNESER